LGEKRVYVWSEGEIKKNFNDQQEKEKTKKDWQTKSLNGGYKKKLSTETPKPARSCWWESED